MVYDLGACPECTPELEFFASSSGQQRVNIKHQPDCPYKTFNISNEELLAS